MTIGSEKQKWLATHDFRSSPDAFKLKLAPLMEILGDVEVDFVPALHPARGEPKGFEWWSSPTFNNYFMGWIGDVGLDESLEYQREKVAKDGPYAGVIGFSQGGAMAHSLLTRGLVQRGILFSPVLPSGRKWPPGENTSYDAVVIYDPADLTGENYPRAGIPETTHSENHVVPVLTDKMKEMIRAVAEA